MNANEALAVLGMMRAQETNVAKAQALALAIDALERQPDFRQLGRKGGKATKAAHGPEYFRRVGKLGGRPRKENNGKQHKNR